MKWLLNKKSMLIVSIVSAILLIIIPDLQVALETSYTVDFGILIFFRLLIIPFLFYGFVLLGKYEKNNFLVYSSYTVIVWSIISAILRYGNILQSGIILDWVIFLIFGLSLFKIKKIGLISKITSIYITILSLIVIFTENPMGIVIGTFNWVILGSVLYALPALTLYQYLQTMRRRHRRK